MKNRKRPRNPAPKRSPPPPRIHQPSGPSPSRPAEPDPVPAQLARIDQISLAARTTWFGLLAYLAFVVVTLLGVEDADFFVPSRQTQLPLVNVAIPTSSFFWFAPVLGAALYAYLHLQLLKLWEALAQALPKHRGKPISELVYPWLIADYALGLREDTLRDGSMHSRPLAWLSHIATWALVWAAGPFVLIGFWLVSMPAHDPWMTLTISTCVLVSLFVGISSHWTLLERIAHPHGHPRIWASRGRRIRAVAVAAWLTAATISMTIGIPGLDGTPEPAKLRGVELVERPADWRVYSTARRRFRASWCRQQGFDLEVCNNLYIVNNPNKQHVLEIRADWCTKGPRQIDDCQEYFDFIDANFIQEWLRERRNIIGNLERLDLRGKDFRGSDLKFAFVPGADFRKARLQRAKLNVADLQGADFSAARLQEATLRFTRLQGASFVFARLQGTDFVQAYLQYSVFTGANLREAELEGSNLTGADFTEARLHSAKFFGAQMNGVVLENANVRGADLRGKNVTQEMVDSAFGDRSTLLPDQISFPDHWDPSTIGADDEDPKFEAWLAERLAAKKQQTTTSGD